MSPVFNPDGSLKGTYDRKGNFYAGGGSRNSGLNVAVLGASPTLVNASISRPPPPSSTRKRTGGVSRNRSLNSDGDIPSQGILQRQGSPQVYSMPGSSYPTAGGHSQTHVEAISSLSSVSFMNDSSRADYPMDLHLKEATMQSQQSSMGRHGGFYFGGAPTSNYPPQLQHAQAVSSSGISSQTGGPPGNGSGSVNAAMGCDQPLQHLQNTSQFHGQKMSAIGQPIRDVGAIPMQAPQSAPDPFCMLSLCDEINKSNPHVTTLALGLDMTSKEKLFKTSASPRAKKPRRDDFVSTLLERFNAYQEPPPHQGMFRIYEAETLFYVFYRLPEDEAHPYAVDELYDRDWFYHKELKCWFLRIGEPLEKTNAYERGTYDSFDPEKFKFVRKENIFIYYEKLEKRPSLPQHRM